MDAPAPSETLERDEAPSSSIPQELVDKFASRAWRLENLYSVTDEYGKVVQFKFRPAQRKLLDELHYLNIILKARQEGFSTLILLIALDCCLFNDHFAAGLIADTKVNAENLLVRAKFAYASMPEELQKAKPVLSDNSTTMRFANGSWIEVGVSLRSATKNLIHISEYGKICAKTPEKAEEIKSGSLNTLAPRQLAFIESTAEGKGGDFYDKVQEARRILDSGREHLDMEWKLHFFPWWADLKYSIDQRVPLTADEEEYFRTLEEEHGIKLTPGQEWWYALKAREQTDTMTREYPSFIDEAFSGVREGSIFGKWIRNLRILKRISPAHSYVPGIAVNTFWDFGLNDLQVIWLHQEVAGRNRFVGYYENAGMGLNHYAGWLRTWAERRSAVFGQHYPPHDVEHRRQGLTVKTLRQIAAEAGIVFRKPAVTRNPNKWTAIETARSRLPSCEFDELECKVGLEHLEEYSRVWDERNSTWLNEPRHDQHSNGADGFMTFSDGYKPPPPPKPKQDIPTPSSFYSR
jgi:hypothetical protein